MIIVIVVMVVAVVVTVPVMVVLNSAAVSVPVTREISLSIMMRNDPASALIRRPRPIARVPFVMVSNRIPVTLYPDEFGAWPHRYYRNHTGGRRSADPDSDGDLCLGC